MLDTFTIKQLIQLESLVGLRIVEDGDGLDNVITNVNIIDNPDSYEWFTAGDFLLTTGYIYQDNEQLQRNLIKELSEMNCAGLGIKVKRYWQEIPKAIREEARVRKLPIIEIPFTYSLAQVSNIINNEIFKRENSLLKKYRSIHDTYARISLEGGDLWQIVKITSQLVCNPVILVDSEFNLLSYAELYQNPYPLKDYMSLELRQKCFPLTFTDSIPKSTDQFTLSIKRYFKREPDIICRIIPVAYSNSIYGYIVVWETCNKLSSIDYIALENAATTAALERVKTKQLEESRDRMREDFFDDLIQGKIISLNAMKNLARIHGLNPDLPHVVAVIQVDEIKKPLKFISDIVYDIALASHRKIQMVIRQNHVMMFIEFDHHVESQKGLMALKHLMSEISDEVTRKTDQKFTIGVSNICTEFSHIGKSALIAIDVLKISNKMKSTKKVHYFQELMGYHLLDSVFDKQKLKDFYDLTLGPLVIADKETNGELLTTIEAYFQANGNLSEAAKLLFIHRNTFIYRLDKIKKILDVELNEPESNFNIQMALRIRNMINMK